MSVCLHTVNVDALHLYTKSIVARERCALPCKWRETIFYLLLSSIANDADDFHLFKHHFTVWLIETDIFIHIKCIFYLLWWKWTHFWIMKYSILVHFFTEVRNFDANFDGGLKWKFYFDIGFISGVVTNDSINAE